MILLPAWTPPMSVSPLPSSVPYLALSAHPRLRPEWRRRRVFLLPRLPLRLRSSGLSSRASRLKVGPGDELYVEDGGGTAELEDELYEFMVNSANPRTFPSRRDLIAAGRMDLVQAIANRGGWLSLGWDREAQEPPRNREGEAVSSTDASSSQRLDDVEGEMKGGIEGILSRLEKERSLSFGLTPVEKGLNGQYSKAKSRSLLLESRQDESHNKSMSHNSSMEITVEDVIVSEKNCLSQIQLRLQRLESKLKSTLGILRSKSAIVLPEARVNSSKQLDELCDDWEFQETEIVKARENLRLLRAKLSVLQGKMSLDVGEAQAMLVERQKRIDAAQTALQTLRTVCIVWPNTASEVMLCGSFDGWTSQRRMERSSNRVFSICIVLYPGQYEIKFVVDGVWRIDPLRPVVTNNGHENNLLLVT